jgi:transposase
LVTHPAWAIKHKRKGSELRLLNGRYYLYEVKSQWDPVKKRSRKITGKLLGKITKEDGFIESDKAKLRKRELSVSQLSVKEFGIVAFIESHLSIYKDLLQKHFPNQWQEIMSLAYCKLVHKSALKNVEFHYLHSYLSELFPKLSLSSKHLTFLLQQIGSQRSRILEYFKEFGMSQDNILFDGTDIISNSRKMELTKFSKSKKGTFESLVNIMFIFSVRMKLPLYYRILPGNIKDIKAFKLSLEESHISDAVIIADKGFYSGNNIELLKKENLKFIIPLRRNNTLIDYEKIQTGNKEKLEGFFKFENRIIWYYTAISGDVNINVYLDEELKAEEIKDYLDRTESLPEKYNLKEFHDKQFRFGTISLMNNLDKSPSEIFTDYKSRSQIESMIDALKNIIDSDCSYMHNEQALEAWMFINYIALHWYYKILQLLKVGNLNSKYSPTDLITFLKEIRKVKINGTWFLAEITKKTQSLIDSLNIHIT